jgi:puromycin-sensitive aminopeptidase
MSKQTTVRLPAHVIPERYRIMLKPDLETFTFRGEETIYFHLTKASKQIILHAKDLKIHGAEVEAKRKGQKDIWAAKISYNKKTETVTLTFPKIISSGKHELKLSFSGVLNDLLRGFYRSKYEHQGKEKYLATTQFEATDARRAFPCFDEPAQKAVFDVTLLVPQHMAAISNTIETEVQHHDNGYKVVKFAPTPKMSTYLLAFIVGDLEFIEGKTRDGALVRVFTTPGKKHQAKFALEVGIKTLEFFNKWFDIPYPLPVLDMIAVPDFASGAMENWGAVTYRETALLVDEDNTALVNRQYVAHVIAHELTHQWFGNLVTMEWWTHLWLNESFATYMSYVAVAHLYPKWDMWSQFVNQELGPALHLDALRTTHPIEVQVHHPDQIDEIFDAISYDKGASVVRMLAEYLGEKDFRDGLRYYLKKHSYKNTSTIHLWEAFEKVSGKPIRKMMAVWTKRPGYPLITLAQRAKQPILTQNRFFSSAVTRKSARDSTVWPVPIKLSANRKAEYQYLTTRGADLGIKARDIKLNVGEVGFYRVKYSPEHLQYLGKKVQENKLAKLDRLGIIRDAFALAEAGEVSATTALDVAQQYTKEESYVVWLELLSGLSAIDGLLAGQPSQKLFHKYGLQLLSNIAKKIDWQPKPHEAHNTTLLRSLILGALGTFGHEPTIARARKIFHQSANKSIHPDIRAVVYYTMAQFGTKQDFDLLIKKYQAATLQEEKNRLGRALTQFPQIPLIKRSLKFAFSSEVRLQDAPLLYIFLWRNQRAWNEAWQFMKNHWDMLLERYGQGGRMLSYMVKPLSNFSDQNKFDEIRKFLRTHPVPGGAMTVEQTLEKLESNIDWKRRDLAAINKYLKDLR